MKRINLTEKQIQMLKFNKSKKHEKMKKLKI